MTGPLFRALLVVGFLVHVPNLAAQALIYGNSYAYWDDYGGGNEWVYGSSSLYGSYAVQLYYDLYDQT